MAAPKAICIVRTETLAKEFIVEPTTPVEEFMKMIAENFEHNLEKLELLLQNSMCPMLTIDPKVPTLSDTGIIFDNEARNIIMLLSTEKKNTKKTEISNGDAKVHTITTKFRGLINQSNTCYLNCFLQSLFMIPEIKNRVLNWNIKQDDLCILSQLQKLFIKLEVSEDNAVSTREFTNSFKWFVQHMEDHQDVHEFLAALLDGIQEASKKYNLPDIVTEFYLGMLLERLRCSGCDVVKYKDVPFLHIQLPVKNLEGVLYDCIENIIKDYTSTEWLTDSDQLFCERCNKKCDTEKGQIFKTLPYLLNLSLSRFDYDCNKMRVVKINGRITFPLELTITDMNNTPFKYELMSVIVHKGTPSCGHYYADIKDVYDNSWYLFDDRNVYSIDVDELEKAFGVGVTTGYVFIYRMIDESKNEMPIRKENFSEDLKKLALNYTNTRETVYIFKIHLKRGEKTSVLRKFISFGFNTLDDLKRRVTSHLNIMMPEIDTDDIRLALYNIETGEVDRYFEEKDFSTFLSESLENNGDVIHILYEANKERPLEEDEISISSYSKDQQMIRPINLPKISSVTETKKKLYYNEDDDKYMDLKNIVKSHMYVDANYLRNYIFNGKIILNADLLLLINNLAKIFIFLCEQEVNEKDMTGKELKRYIKKITKSLKSRDDQSIIEMYYPRYFYNGVTYK